MDINQGRQKRPRYGYLSDKIEGIRIVVDLIAVEKCMALKGYWVAEFVVFLDDCQA